MARWAPWHGCAVRLCGVPPKPGGCPINRRLSRDWRLRLPAACSTAYNIPSPQRLRVPDHPHPCRCLTASEFRDECNCLPRERVPAQCSVSASAGSCRTASKSADVLHLATSFPFLRRDAATHKAAPRLPTLVHTRAMSQPNDGRDGTHEERAQKLVCGGKGVSAFAASDVAAWALARAHGSGHTSTIESVRASPPLPAPRPPLPATCSHTPQRRCTSRARRW